MKMQILALAALATTVSCHKDLVQYQRGDMKITIEKGSEWLHDFPLFWGIKLHNPPQIAIWAEDMQGNYLGTLYVSRRTATGKWRGGKNIRRPEALPTWTHVCTNLPDAVSGATPRGSFEVKIHAMRRSQFVVKTELNHSRDWNEHWPASAPRGRVNYSAESGQPAVIYAAKIDLDKGLREFHAVPIGHGSPDGSDGNIRLGTETLTTALNIVNRITIEVQ